MVLSDKKFFALDKLIAEDFLASLPPNERNYLAHIAGQPVDTDLYMVHLVPHACVAPIIEPIKPNKPVMTHVSSARR